MSPDFKSDDFLKPEVFTGKQVFGDGKLPKYIPRADDDGDYRIMDEVAMCLRSTVENEEDL